MFPFPPNLELSFFFPPRPEFTGQSIQPVHNMASDATDEHDDHMSSDSLCSDKNIEQLAALTEDEEFGNSIL